MQKTIAISEIIRDIAQIFFASVVIAPIMSGIVNGFTFFVGISFSIVLWLLSIAIIK